MFDNGIGVEQLQFAYAVAQAVIPVGDAAPSVANQAGETGVDTLFNIIELGTRIFIGLLTSAAVLYAGWGGFLLMRSAGNPQMLEKARMQVILALVGVGIGVSAFLLVGTAIDFISGASGGTVVDVGDVSKVNNTGRQVPVGSFLGIYGGEAVLCPSSDPGWSASVKPEIFEAWRWTAEVTGPPVVPAFCTSQ